MGLTFHWNAWKMRVLFINRNSTVTVRKDIHSDSAMVASYRLTKVSVQEMESNAETENERESGIIISCQTLDGYEASFRCILNETDMEAIKAAIKEVAGEHNIEDGLRNSITEHVNKAVAKSRASARGSQSVMRRAIARAMDKQDKRSLRDKIVAKRGTMKYLPVLFANDLVHGSW